MQTYEPVTVLLSKGETEDLSRYLDLVELPVRLEPLIGGLFQRKMIKEAELKNYIVEHRVSGNYSHFVILTDGTEVPLIEYMGLTEGQYEALFQQVLLPFGITHIYEMDMLSFVNGLERPKVRQRVN